MMPNETNNCPLCDTPMEEGSDWYCEECCTYFCPICQQPHGHFELESQCSHYVLEDFETGEYVVDARCRDEGLIGRLLEFEKSLTQNSLSEDQIAFLESLTREEIHERFGKTREGVTPVVGWDDDGTGQNHASFVIQNLPFTHMSCQDGPGWSRMFFHEDGGDKAWAYFLPILKQQLAGLAWLQEQTG